MITTAFGWMEKNRPRRAKPGEQKVRFNKRHVEPVEDFPHLYFTKKPAHRKLGKVIVAAYAATQRRNERSGEKKHIVETLFGKPAYMAWEMRKKK